MACAGSALRRGSRPFDWEGRAVRFLPGAAFLILLPGLCGAAELTIGLIPEQNVFKQKERYTPLGQYLERKTGVKIQFTILSRYGNILDRFAAEHMDGAFFGSFTGALAIRRLGVEPLARPVNLDGTSTYRGYIFVRKDGGIRTVADMKGKRLAFVERSTTAGYVYPMAFFREKGVSDIAAYFSEHYFAGSHDATVYAVLEGKADVGCAKHSMFDRLARKDPRVERELVILDTSPEVPSNGLCVRSDLDAQVKAGLAAVLLKMDQEPEGIDVLRKFEALRFVPTSKDDYVVVLKIAERAGIDLDNYSYSNE